MPFLKKFKKRLITLSLIFILLYVVNYLAPHVIAIDYSLHNRQVIIERSKIDKLIFVKGMRAVENLLLIENSYKLYVGDSTGNIYLLNGDSWQNLSIVKKQQLSKGWVLGLCKLNNGKIYAAATDYEYKQWISKGGFLVQLNPDLTIVKKHEQLFPGINGMTSIGDTVYFATGNMSFIKTGGTIYQTAIAKDGVLITTPLITARKSFNGMFYDKKRKRLLVGDTFSGVSVLAGDKLHTLVQKVKLIDAFDDFCVDSQGRLWIADPGSSFIKMYDPATHNVIRFVIKGLGQSSSVQVRSEGGVDILYIGEIRQELGFSAAYDGRGVVIVPVETLLDFII